MIFDVILNQMKYLRIHNVNIHINLYQNRFRNEWARKNFLKFPSFRKDLFFGEMYKNLRYQKRKYTGMPHSYSIISKHIRGYLVPDCIQAIVHSTLKNVSSSTYISQNKSVFTTFRDISLKLSSTFICSNFY